MDPKSKLQHQERTELQAEVQAHAHSTPPGKAFESVEDLLRHDAAQTHPPPQLQVRLAQSIANQPAPSRPWWKRILRSS